MARGRPASIALATLAAALVASAVSSAATPARTSVSHDVILFGGADHARETHGRPLRGAVAVFSRPREAVDHLPRALITPPFGLSLTAIVGRLKGDPGVPLVGEARSAPVIAGTYVVPTSHGWACFVNDVQTTCDHGLLPQGIAWHVTDAGSPTLAVFGFAATDVRSVVLEYGRRSRRAVLSGGVFYTTRPFHPTSPKHAPFGSLVIRYADGGTATVALL